MVKAGRSHLSHRVTGDSVSSHMAGDAPRLCFMPEWGYVNVNV